MAHVTLDTTAKVYFWIEAVDDETGKLRSLIKLLSLARGGTIKFMSGISGTCSVEM